MVNKMKLILTLLLLTLGSYSSMNAQPNRSSAQPGVQNFILQYGDALELTDQQKSELITLQIEQRSTMQSERQKGRMGQQQKAKRGQQRGAMRSDSGRNRLNQSNRAELRSEHREAMMNILTDEQKEKLNEIQADRVENRSEVLMLRNKILVESSVSDSDKAEEVIGLLNRITEIQKENQLYRIENRGETDREKLVENVAEIRSIQDELKSKITIDEYQLLRPALANGPQRSEGRGMRLQRNR